MSHLRLWTQDPDGSSAVGEESADLLLALDLLVATDPQHLVRASAGRTVTVASTSLVPTAGMVRGESAAPDLTTLLGAVRERTRPGRLTTVDTVALATALFGDGVAANLIARLIERYHWIAYIGLIVILYVAGSMIHEGFVDPKVGLGQLLGWI